MGLQISVTFTKMTFNIMCSFCRPLLSPAAVLCGPLRCLLWSFAVLCRPLLSPAVLCGVCCGPFWSFAVFVMVLCGPLRYLVRPVPTTGITDFSYPRTKGPYGELSYPRNESSRNFRSQDLSFPGTFVLGERKFPGTFVLGNFRSHYPIGLVAALLCMFGCECDFTLMMLTAL